MEAFDLVARELQYDHSPNYLPISDLSSDPDYGFLYRKARSECHVQGAYLLRGREQPNRQANVPLVYVCTVDTEQEARRVHKSVWNQDLVPFLIIISPTAVRLYPGFQYERGPGTDGALCILEDFNRVASELSAFRASAIDSGEIWREWGGAVRAESRVDWHLLRNLRQLEKQLASTGLDDRDLIHAAIGKFVYLRYLRDRDILSDRKLRTWGLDVAATLSREAEPEAFYVLNERLDEWLNGSIFPLTNEQIMQFGVERLRLVAGVFRGDLSAGQLALDFADYDFSFIPIETLSVIYEQFLHAPGASAGRAQGAYYTPVPVVNYIIDRLDREVPLKHGMRILDPACGSGAFLVQCYRRLIEGQVVHEGFPPSPLEARDILTESIFGIDTDLDACQIAELSLILTLLDYVKPPDLETPDLRRFLPSLRDRNIICGNAFDDSITEAVGAARGFDRIVGNPPWKELTRGSTSENDKIAARWAAEHQREHPIGGLQLAELFAWRTFSLLTESGVAGLLLPAMTLFKSESKVFRQEFFARAAVWSVANFANLANVLFRRRSTLPAMALFFSRAAPGFEPGRIEVHTPFLANQPSFRRSRPNQRRESWNLIVGASEIKELRYSDVLGGDSVTWKVAAWGSFLDQRLLQRVKQSFWTLSSLEDDGLIVMSQGMETRDGSTSEAVERHPELAGRRRVLVGRLKGRRHLLRFPELATARLSDSEIFVRRRGGFDRPNRVSMSPHVIVGASRSFAIYDEQSLLVPPRQIGIAAERGKPALLRALALYLNSDFAYYHQFFTTPEAGVQKTRNTLESLGDLPVPFTENGSTREWDELFEHLVTETGSRDDFDAPALVDELNELTARSLGLTKQERALVQDFIKVRLTLTRGKVTELAVGRPIQEELDAYAVMLRDELDSFMDDEVGFHHGISVAGGDQVAVAELRVVRDASTVQPGRVSISRENFGQLYAQAQRYLSAADSQWPYFRRNLRIYTGSSTYLLKPFERLHWTRTQAMLDAAELLAEMIAPEPGPGASRAG